MKRRGFIAALIAGLGVGVLSILIWRRKPTRNLLLAQPKFLSRLCDTSTIQGIGRAYLTLNPGETSDSLLWNDLLTGPSSKEIAGSKEIADAESEIEKKIKLDFENDKIVVVQGWVLSITEAKQCAIFSMVTS